MQQPNEANQSTVGRSAGSESNRCIRCGAPMGRNASECDVCGTGTAGRGGRWDRPTWFVVMMLLFLGPFGLPWVWFHPRYSSAIKWLISAVMIVGTLALCGLLVAGIWLIVKQLHALLSGLHDMPM